MSEVCAVRRLQLPSARFALNHHLLLLLLHRRCSSDFNEKPKEGLKPRCKFTLQDLYKESTCLNPTPSTCDVFLVLQLRAESCACAAADPGSAAQPRVSPASAAGNPAEGAVQVPRRQLDQRGARFHPNAIRTRTCRSRKPTAASLHVSGHDIA